jgi:hypothetical protein
VVGPGDEIWGHDVGFQESGQTAVKDLERAELEIRLRGKLISKVRRDFEGNSQLVARELMKTPARSGAVRSITSRLSSQTGAR